MLLLRYSGGRGGEVLVAVVEGDEGAEGEEEEVRRW
jgi:hypothetical protein